MGDNIQLILLKSEGCGHCKSFLPIFEKAVSQNICDYDIYDINDEKKYSSFENDFPDIVKKFDKAVPTIYIVVKDKFQEVRSSRIMGEGEKELNIAVNTFIDNVKNGIKTLQSNNHTVYIQAGGNKNEEYYKNKYIKYKTKYLQKKIK